MTACERCDATSNVERSEVLGAVYCGACFGAHADSQRLAQSLTAVEGYICGYVVLTLEQAVAVVLWVAHTHVIEAAWATPYLAITSVEKRSGKTRLLEACAVVVARPWFTGGTSKAALVRKVDSDTPTLLLDESDAAFSGDKEYGEALRGVLNTGYSRAGSYTVCIGQGAKIEAKDFKTFCPKAIAGIGQLPDTVADRSIPIRLKRRRAGEAVERFRERQAKPVGVEIAEGLVNALEPFIEQLATAEPSLPDQLDDRAQDVWESLFAIADAAGGEWPERARAAALKLSGGLEPDEATLGVRLLADCRDAFGDDDRITSRELLEHLHGIEDGPWADWYGKPMTARKVADLLRGYEIKKKQIRVGDENTKGYLREAFQDAWDRYIPPPNGNIRSNRMNKPETAPSQSETQGSMFPMETGHKPHEQADVSDVSDSRAVDAGNGVGESNTTDPSDLGLGAHDDEDLIRTGGRR